MPIKMMRNPASLLLPSLALCAGVACRSVPQSRFASPEAALQELADTVGTHDQPRTERLLGRDGLELLQSGDDVADREDALRVQQLIREKIAFEERGADTRIALLGDDGWPLPIPLVRDGGAWRFDVVAGSEEVANRRIGRNELSTIASLHAYVDAQREYAAVERDGRPRAYAHAILSSAGKHDGLYWPAAVGEPQSPLGPLIAAATDEGYRRSEGERTPFHGYRFRTLTSQGKHAPGGEKSFVDEKGALTRGFAMLAWPAKYGSSGVMTLLVGSQGIVYQKDLGADTSAAVARITTFDPDESWDPTGD